MDYFFLQKTIEAIQTTSFFRTQLFVFYLKFFPLKSKLDEILDSRIITLSE